MTKPIRNLFIGLTGLVSLCMIVPFLIPVPELDNTAPPEDVADPDSLFLEIEDLRVHYKISGEGEPAIVLLHGFVSSVFAWREVMDPLSAYGTVIAFDRTGFGLTERPLKEEWDGESPYSAEAHADLTIGLIDALGFDQAILIGNSAGGSVAIDVAHRYPDRISGLVLVDAAVYYQPGPPGWITWLLRTPQIERLAPLLVRAMPNFGETLLNLAWHDPSLVTPEVWEGYLKPTGVHDWDAAFWQLVLTSDPPHLEEVVTDLSMPVLVVTGDDDRVVPTAQSVRLASEIPGAQLVILDQCGHLPQEECPESFLQAVSVFLSSLP
jgi:pimeloyl-ACP methyl ester carboxylesterase